jgi:Ni,Fe-hydrogenase III large subunit
MIGAATKVDPDGWRRAIQSLAAGERTLVALWAEPGKPHLATAGPGGVEMIALSCPAGVFPSVGAHHPPAIRPERAITDLYGLTPYGAADKRPWLDHGKWATTPPLGPKSAGREPAPYRFLAAEGEGLHEIPVGPVHAGIIEPGHFRFTASGETVVRLEERLGYVHRGLEGLMRGAVLERAARLAGRACGDSTVAYAVAFARAVEAALEVEAPPRAHALRALMAELERLANHLGDIGAICNDAAFAILHAHCGVLREQVLRAAERAFGHRLMMDQVAPGGVARDIGEDGSAAIDAALATVARRFEWIVAAYDDTASLQDRTVGTGVVSASLAKQFGAGGYVGRASGRAFDARKAFPYPPYDRLEFEVPVREEGDVNARVWIRIEEVRQSLRLARGLTREPPETPIRVAIPEGAGEAAALVEGFRGDVFASVRIEGGRVAHAHLRDPSWFQWPLLEAAIEGNIVADFPLCNKSFNCAYAGVDL